MFFLSRYEPQVYAILRIIAGFLFLWHGSQKLFDIPPTGHPIEAYIIDIAGPIEFVGGVLITLGLWSRWAAFFACGEMAYVYWTVHAPKAALPVLNGGELAMLYCFVFMFILVRGSGIFSLDHYWHTRSA